MPTNKQTKHGVSLLQRSLHLSKDCSPKRKCGDAWTVGRETMVWGVELGERFIPTPADYETERCEH